MDFVSGDLAFLQMWTARMSLAVVNKTTLNTETSKTESSDKITSALPEKILDGMDFGNTAVLFGLIFSIWMTHHLLLTVLSSIDVGNRFPSRTLYPPTDVALNDLSLNVTSRDSFGSTHLPNKTTSTFVSTIFIFAAFSAGVLLGNRAQRFMSQIFTLPVHVLDAYFIRIMKKYNSESS
jgi:hypothetical protein